MGNTKKERKGRKFKFHINKKWVNKKQNNTGTAAVSVPIVKHAWDEDKTIRENLTSMGLAYDANVTLKIPTTKEMLKTLVNEKATPKEDTTCPSKAHIAQELEANANAPRVKKFQLPAGQILFLTYLIDKYGDDYEAMARDNKNIYQETWRQIRNKIRTFQRIPSQWNAYLASRSESGNMDNDESGNTDNDESGNTDNDESGNMDNE